MREKYEGSAELCIRILRKYATEPLVEIQKLFRTFLFSWWTANGDMHLKNFSLLTTTEGVHRLSPAYDFVCTRLVLPDDDKQALSVGGRDKSLTRRTWFNFANTALDETGSEAFDRGQIDVIGYIDRLHQSIVPRTRSRRNDTSRFFAKTPRSWPVEV